MNYTIIKKIIVIWFFLLIPINLIGNLLPSYNNNLNYNYKIGGNLLPSQVNFIHRLYYSNYPNKCQLIYIGGVESSFGRFLNHNRDRDESYGYFHILLKHAKHYNYTDNEFKEYLLNDFEFNVIHANFVYDYFYDYGNDNNWSIGDIFKGYNCGHNIDRDICNDYLDKIKSMDIYVYKYAQSCQLYPNLDLYNVINF